MRVPRTVVDAEQGVGLPALKRFAEIAHPFGKHAASPLTPGPVGILQYPGGFGPGISGWHPAAAGRTEKVHAAIAEAGLGKDRIRGLELRMPMQVVEPDPVHTVSLKQVIEYVHPVFPEPGIGGTNTHKPVGGLGLLAVLIDRPGLRMPLQVFPSV